MAKQVQRRGGSTAQHAVFTGADREITVDTTKKTLVVHDGVTAGGTPLAKESQVPAAANATPAALGTAAIGSSTDYAREDHVHAMPTAADVGAAASGAIGSSGLTMATARLLGRTTASTGAVEEITVGTGLSLTGGTLSATGGGGSSDYLAALVNSEVAITTTATATINSQHLISGTTADYTVTLPAASGNAGKFIAFRINNTATKIFTIKGNASELIDGQNTRAMWAGETATLYCDGTGWQKIAGKTRPMQCQIASTSTQSISTATMTDVTLSRVDVDNSGAMADTANSRIKIVRPGQYLLMGHLIWNGTSAAVPRLIGQITNSNTAVAITAHDMNAYTSSCFPSCQPYALSSLLVTSTIKLQAYMASNVSSVYGVASGDTTMLLAMEVPSW